MSRFSIAFVCLVAICGISVGDEESKPEQPKAKPKKNVIQINAQAVVQLGAFANQFGKAKVRTDVDPQENVERFVVLAPRGPIVVEATLLLDGKPFRMAREKLVDEMLKAADTNNDGKSTWKEALDNKRFLFGRTSARVIVPIQMPAANPPKKEKNADGEKKDDEKKEEKKKPPAQPQQIQMRIIQFGNQNAAQKDEAIKHFDKNKNGIVDRNEARSLLAQTAGGAAFVVNSSFNRYRQPDVKTLLDTDKDGTISKDELASATKQLKSKDANDNDLLEPGELGGNGMIRAGGNVIAIRAVGNLQANRSASAHLLGPAADYSAIHQALVKKYGVSEKITAKSFPLFPRMFQQVDSNKNGALDLDEVKNLDKISPHVQLQANLGNSKPSGIAVISLADELGNKKTADKQFKKETVLSLLDMKLRFAAGQAPQRKANYNQTGKSMVQRYDTNKDGYIEEKEVVKVNKFLKQQFERWDADSNGKVYAEEIAAMYIRQQAPVMSRVSTMVGEKGPSLFSALDTTGDNRLSLREMNNAAKQLLSKDKNGDGEIGLEEIPIEMSVALAQGNYYGANLFKVTQRRPAARPNQAKQDGPDWFTRMDRNGDGDVTLREFLGDEEQFKKIDTNGDGFIELKEAKAAKLPGLSNGKK